MKRHKQFTFLSFIALFLLLVPTQQVYAQDHQHGKVDFSISCNEEARDSFNQGLALLHHMMYEQAESQFANAAAADPDCAMAHWGIAMTVIHPLWGERPSDEAFKKGEKAVSNAKALSATTEREAAYIAAVEKFYQNWINTGYADQLAAFETGFGEVHKAFPNDIDAAAFYALGQLATAPKTDKTFSNQKKAGALLEKLHEHAPEHPGLFHYIIHAYDNPVLAEHAVEVARNYDRMAPEVPHALHMPSHIFVRQGYWPDVINWNKRSAEAALQQPVGNMTSMHYAHALDYLMYAYLQQGEDRKAKKVQDEMNSINNFQPSLGAAYAIAAVHARYPLERGKWHEAAALPSNIHGNFPWDQHAAAESILHFTRGMGAARSNNPEAATKAIEILDDIHARLIEKDEQYWATLTDAQRTTIAAWMAFSNGEEDQALALMNEAADKEDSVDKHPVTPGHVLPARELLGDMLFAMGKPGEALLAYESSLKFSANRFNSLYGAGKAAELSGEMQKAKTYYTTLIKIAGKENIERPAITKARKFLAVH